MISAWTSDALQLDSAVEAAFPPEVAPDSGFAAEAALAPRLAVGELAQPLPAEPSLFVDAGQVPVEPSDLALAFLDLLAERAAVARASERAELAEPPLHQAQLVQCMPAFLLDGRLALEKPAIRVRDPNALGERPAASRGVEGERLGGRAGECFGKPVDRPGRLDPTRWRVRLELILNRVQAAQLAGAAEGDVSPLLERAPVVGEHERPLDGESLRLVAGERVRVRDVSGLEVAGGQGDAPVVIEFDDERTVPSVDGVDGAAAAVCDGEPAVVAGQRTRSPVASSIPFSRRSRSRPSLPSSSSKTRATLLSSATSARR